MTSDFDIDKPPVGLPSLLVKEVGNMERSRGWFDKPGQPGIKNLLTGKRSEVGDNNAIAIEGMLNIGGATLVELGAGNLSASRELANFGPRHEENSIIAVEPFLDDRDLEDLPVNIKVVRKRVEDLTSEDIPDDSVDACFSAGHAFNYVEDKLRFINQVWRILKPEATASVEFFGQPIVPPLDHIFAGSGLKEAITIETTGGETYAAHIKKIPGKDLNFGDYSFQVEPSHYFKTDVRSTYEFK